MQTALRAVRTGLGTPALATGVAAQRVVPQLDILRDLVHTCQIRYCTNLSQITIE
jgi:hypothetical protein